MAGLAAVRLYIINNAQLFPDEALYHFFAQRASSVFCPHPPGTPFMVRLGIAAVGKTELGVRLLPFLLAMLTVVPVVALAREIGGRVAARWSLAALATTPLFVMVGAICTPDGAQLFFYSAALYFTWKALQTGRVWLWLATGLIIGIGLFVKYIIIIYFPALFLCLLVSPAFRHHLARPGPYLACLAAFLVFVPVFVISEMPHGWPALQYHLNKRQRFQAPSIKDIAVYHLAHVGFYSPLLYGLYMYAMGVMVYRAIALKNSVAAFLASFALVPWGFFAVVITFTQRELSREQWDSIAYIPAVVASGVLLAERHGKTHSRYWPRFHLAAAALGLTIIMLVAIEGGTGSISGSLGRKPLFSNLSGWKLMATEADKLLAELPQPATGGKLLVGDTFAPALQYYFYSPQPAKAISIWSRRNEKYGLETVLNATGAGQYELPRHMGANALFVVEVNPRKTNRDEIANRYRELLRMFERVETSTRVTAYKGDQKVKAFQFYKCYNLRFFQAEGIPWWEANRLPNR